MSGYQVMPRLSADEYADLEQSIKTDGVLVPIIVSPGGEIIDGHHRAEIARRLGIICSEVVKHGEPAELRTFAYSLNLNRRHLTREQRRDLIAQSLRQDPQLADREHARRTGASPTTVGAVRTRLEDAGDVSKLDTRTDALGRQQPARYALGDVAEEFGADLNDDAPDQLGDRIARELAASDANYAEQSATRAPVQQPRTVLGTDGKTYSAPAKPSAPRRRPLPEAFWQASYDLTKVAERIARLADDDRFPQNAKQVATANRGDLLRAIDALQSVVNRLPSA